MTTAGETLTLIVSLGHSVIILSVLSLLKRDGEGSERNFYKVRAGNQKVSSGHLTVLHSALKDHTRRPAKGFDQIRKTR